MIVDSMYQSCFVTGFRFRGVEKGNDQLADISYFIQFLYKLECCKCRCWCGSISQYRIGRKCSLDHLHFLEIYWPSVVD